MHWIDIVVIAFVVIFAIIGLWKGFFDGLFSLCSIFVSLLIAINTSNWFANIIRKIVDIDGWFDHFLSNTCNVGDSLVIFGASYPREKVAAFLTVLLSGILIFIFIRCLIRLLKNLFKSISNSSATIGLLNRIFGIVLGGVKAGVLIVIILGVCSIITSLGIPKLSDNIAKTIGETKVTSFIYEYVDKFVDGKMDGKSFDEIIDGIFDEETAKEQDENTILKVVYDSGKNSYDFVVGQAIDYSKIIVIYKAGDTENSTSVVINESNFVEKIDVSVVATGKTATISAYGKTTTLIYNVVQGE